MEKLLSEAGRSFLRAYLAVFIPLVAGILAAPNLASARSLSIAAFVASLAAGLKAIQVFIPQLSFSAYLPSPVGSLVDSFLRTFIASLVTFLTGWLAAPELHGWRAIGLSALTGAIAAGIRAIQGYWTPGAEPVPSAGFSPPGTPDKPPKVDPAAGYATR